MAAGFVGFSTFFALSFMAAETLTRRAFGRHPQLWRSWSRGGAGASRPRSSDAPVPAGYLLVSVFFAYDVVLYLVMTKAFGWWSPARCAGPSGRACDVRAVAVGDCEFLPGGFWEEALFRAVPLAGAALIGDRFGHRRPCLVAGFVMQAIVFGSGHAPYPNQPAFARPVELIVPSIGFGLLYVYFGLLPGIILHFAFDVVWFALPIFMASAPGIWFDRPMILALTLVPLWIVLYRRLREGRWTDLPETERNAAWTPPSPREHVEPLPSPRRADIGPGLRRAWLGLGAAGLVFCTFGVVRASSPGPFGTLTLPRADASSLARRAVDQHVADLPPGDRRLSAQSWRVLPAPDAGDASGHEFVVETSGEGRWRSLLGTYLPKPRWRVRLRRSKATSPIGRRNGWLW